MNTMDSVGRRRSSEVTREVTTNTNKISKLGHPRDNGGNYEPYGGGYH